MKEEEKWKNWRSNSQFFNRNLSGKSFCKAELWLHRNKSWIHFLMSHVFSATKTLVQDLPSILWQTCCSLCWSLLPQSLQAFLQPKTWDQLRLHQPLQATPTVTPPLKKTGATGVMLYIKPDQSVSIAILVMHSSVSHIYYQFLWC